MGNPFHLNDEVCGRLKSYGCQKYQLSLDGMRKTRNWLRKPGSFDGTLEEISCIKRAGIRSVIMTTVSGANIKELPGVIDTVVEYGVDVFAFARYCPTGREKDAGMTSQEYRELLVWRRGCPAVASGAYGDFYDAGPQCWKEVTGWNC